MNHIAEKSIPSTSTPQEQTQGNSIHTELASPRLFKLMTYIYITWTVLAEVITMFIGVIPGAILYGILLIALSNLAYFSSWERARKGYVAFTILPMLRLLSLTLPIRQVPPIYQYVMTGIPLLIAVGLILRVNPIPSLRLNLNGLEWVYQIIIALSGIPLGVIASLTLIPPPSLGNLTNLFSIFLLWIVFTVFGAVLEEIIFRGLIQKALSSSLGVLSVFFSSILYASMFLGALSPGYVVFYGLTGLLFAIWVNVTDSILGVIIAHSLMNILFLLISFFIH